MRARTLYSFVVHTWGSQQRAVHAMIERIPISTCRNRGRFINYRGAGVYRKRLLHAFSISLSGWMISSHVAQPFIYYILTSIHDWSMFALRKCGSHSFRSISFERSHSDRFWLRSISDWSRFAFKPRLQWRFRHGTANILVLVPPFFDTARQVLTV